ncbi:MAG: DMT family transporter [Desulfotomaculales bacterium]
MQNGVKPAAPARPVLNPYLVVGLGIAGISFGSLFTRLAAAPPLAIAFYRMFFTTLLLAPFALSRQGRAELAGLSRAEIFSAVGSGFFLALHFFAWIYSLDYTSVASSTVLVTMQPLFVVSGSWLFLREKVPAKSLPYGLLAILGSVVIGFSDFRVGGLALAGDLLAFSGALFIAGYVIIGRRLRQRLSLFPYIFLVYGVSALLLLGFSRLAGTPLFPYPLSTWVCFLALAVVPTIFGHTLFNWALGYLKAAVVSVAFLGEPVGATILALLFLGEVPVLLQVAGGAAILVGVYLFLASSRQEEEAS